MSSDIIDYELSRLTNSVKLQKVRGLYSVSGERIPLTPQARALSKQFEQNGLKLMDSLHLALCEAHGINSLLTTDDNFIKCAARLKLNTLVTNPVAWFMEVTGNERGYGNRLS